MLLSLPKSSSNNQKSNHKTFEKHLRRKVCTMHYFDNILSRYNNFVNIYLIIQNFILFLLLFLLIFCFFRQRKRRSDERLYRNYVVLRKIRRVVSIISITFLSAFPPSADNIQEACHCGPKAFHSQTVL